MEELKMCNRHFRGNFSRTPTKDFNTVQNFPEKFKGILREQKWGQKTPKEAGSQKNLY